MTIFRNSFWYGILLLLIYCLLTARAQVLLNAAPCDFRDTVRLDPATKLLNGSYLYNNEILIPADKIGTYNYEIFIGNKTDKGDVHARGCICQIKQCISICCPAGEEYHNEACIEAQFEPDPYINITIKGQQTVVDINEQFILQFYRPCKGLYSLHPDKNIYDKYSINEDGSLHRHEENQIFDKNHYCLGPRVEDSEFTYYPHQCFLENPVDPAAIKLNAIALLISVPFMILTIIVYLTLPSLRTIHGFSLCCYLAGLCTGYLTLAYLIFESNTSTLLCSILGYTAYFGFMSAFFWLSVISFDLYSNIRGNGTNKKMKQFRLYGLYAWGLAFICLICTYIAQNSDIPVTWKSGIGSADYCFLNGTHGWGALLYFYGPMLLILLFNSVMFVLTFIKIKKKMQSGFTGDHKPHTDHKAVCMAFLRLFIIMGITWLAELLAFFTTTNSWWRSILRVTDFLNGFQGVIIFVLFVCRKSVLKQLLNKFGKVDETRSELSQEMTPSLQAFKNPSNNTPNMY